MAILAAQDLSVCHVNSAPALAPAWSLPPTGPQRIVCMTEETTEWLYLLGQQQRIVGISGYTVRPARARQEKPRVSAFTSAKLDKILALQPDCVLGFSDMQADIASALIRAGVPVTVFNQRSLADIFAMLFQVAAMVGQAAQGLALIQKMQHDLLDLQGLAANLPCKPKVYFEEWDEPPISAIQWVSELIGIAGGQDIFPELAAQPMGRQRIIADATEIVRRNPDIIIGSWCGKKFRPQNVAARPGWSEVAAVKTGQLFEIKSCDILQPGPAALTDGLAQLHRIVRAWACQKGLTGATV
ncbi:MAG: cobalamin-binding protein [Comamonadaceae bacterium]|nr:cobalamin-binding protein [Comamonadaceae bacterium]